MSTRPSRTGFSGQARNLDPVRARRGDQRVPLGPGLTYDSAGRITLDVAGALTFENGKLKVEVAAPLAQASPIRLELDESVEVKNGKLRVKLKAGDGIAVSGNEVRAKPIQWGEVIDATTALRVLGGKLAATKGPSVSKLNQTVSLLFVRDEIQALSDKVDELIEALTDARILEA